MKVARVRLICTDEKTGRYTAQGIDQPCAVEQDQAANVEKKERRGGFRANAGRKPGSDSVLMEEKREAKSAVLRKRIHAGELPHEFLLRVARGEKVNGVLPSLSTRIDAAKAAAPYYAPKLSSVEVLQSLNDDDLDSIIKNAAAEAGLGFSIGREITPPTIIVGGSPTPEEANTGPNESIHGTGQPSTGPEE